MSINATVITVLCAYTAYRPIQTQGPYQAQPKGIYGRFFFANIPHYNCINESQIIEMHDEQRGEEDL